MSPRSYFLSGFAGQPPPLVVRHPFPGSVKELLPQKQTFNLGRWVYVQKTISIIVIENGFNFHLRFLIDLID